MTTNLPIAADLLTEKNLLNLLLAFGNSNDKDDNLGSFLTSLHQNLKLTTAFYLPVNEHHKSHFISSLKKKKPHFKYAELDSILGKKKTFRINSSNVKTLKSTKFSIKKDYYLARLDNLGIIYMEGSNHHKVFGNKNLQLVLKKFTSNVLLCFENEVKSFAEYKNRILIEENSFGMAFINNGKFIHTNKSFSKLTGYTEKEILKISKKDIFDDATLKKGKKILVDFRSGTSKNSTYSGVLKSKSGALIHFKCSSQALYNTDKKFMGSINTFVNTTPEVAATENAKNTISALQDLFDKLTTGLMIFEKNKLVQANDYISSRLGFTEKELLGKKIIDFICPIKHKEISKIVNKNLKNENQIKDLIVPLVSKDNSAKLFLANFMHMDSILGDDRMLVNFVDITSINKAQSELNQKQAMLDNIIENSSQEIFVLDKNKTLIHFNQGSANSFKRIADIELKIGDKLYEKHKKKLDPRVDKLINKALGGKEISFDYNSVNPETKEEIHSVVTVKPFLDEQGEILGILCLAKDVTELVLRNKTIETRESSLRAIIESSADGVYALDKDMNLIFINQQAKKDFSDYYSDVKLEMGDNLYDKIDSETVDKWREVYFDRVFKGERFVYEASLMNKEEGKEYFHENRYSPVKDNDGNIIAALEISRNVTDLRVKERDLMSKEAELRTVLERTPAGIAKVTMEGKINFTTSRTSQLLGLDQTDIIGRNFFSFIHSSDINKMTESLSLLLKGKSEVTRTARVNHGTKDVCYIHGVASLIKDQDGKPVEFLIAFNEITEQVIAENSLSKSEKRYKSLLEGSPAGLAQVNEKGKFIFVSKKGAEILGNSIEEVLQKNFLDYISSHYSLEVSKNLGKLEKANEIMDFRVKGKSGKGKIFYLDGTATLLQDEYDDQFTTMFIFNDVTSRVLAEKELKVYNEEIKEKNAIYKALIDSSFDGIDIIDLEVDDKDKSIERFSGNIVIRNDKMSEYLGDSKNPIVAGTELQRLSPDIQPNGQTTYEMFEEYIPKVLKNSSYSVDWRINSSGNNEDYILGANLISVKDKILLIRNLRRITETKLQQEIINNQLDKLSRKNEELEKYIQSNLQLENFAYIASHDLKAPLRTVSSFSFLLKQAAYEKLDDKSKGYLDIVLRSSNNMQFLIDDLLAFSRVGTQQVKKKEINLGPMLKRILLDLSTNISESNAQINIDKMPASIFADESMMIQLFQNLINNGLKFQKKDISPIVNISAQETKTHWVFKINDNGIGIKEENLAKIFGIFEKLHSNDLYEGTGLGLSICKKIIEIHNGTIEVDSVLGDGSTFIFSIEKKNEL